MKQSIYRIAENIKIAKDIYRMILIGDTSEIKAPGQFINIKLDNMFLRRPISICDYDENTITIIYKVVGNGTEQMSKMEIGETLDILCALGNGYEINLSGEEPLLIGGGVGVPPLYNLAKKLVANGKNVTAVLGFNTIEDSFYVDEFAKIGVKCYFATVDGSLGKKGFVTDCMKDLTYSYVYTCGPEAMLKAVYEASNSSGQFSFEARMGCGFGACMGCSCKTKYKTKRICKDGPVLIKEEIVW